MEELVLVAIGFAIKKQLKGLTDMLCLLMSSNKKYKEDGFLLDFKLKIMYHLKWAPKSLTLKAKHKIK